MEWTGEAIARATGGRLHGEGAAAGPVRTDTRASLAGAWFLALSGARFDGHSFGAAAAAAGAVGGVFSRPAPGWTGSWVEVADTTVALQDLGRAARARLACSVVGLTGSSGKTTTRGLIASALAQLGEVHQTTGNLNNHLGVPMTLLDAPESAAAVVVEMGTSGPGEIAVLADIARPTARLIVNVGPAHLEELGGLDGVAREKGALFDAAEPGDVIALNLDDPRLAAMRPRGRVITWGRDARADVRLIEATLDPERLATVGRYATPDGDVEVTFSVPGVHVAHNAAGALAIAFGLGLDLRRAAADLAGFAPVGMRLKVTPLAGGVLAINDAYNANPASMGAALELLAALPGRRVAVLGDMLELGADEHAWHREVADRARALGLELVVLCGPRMSRAGEGPWCAEAGETLVGPLADWLRPGDRVLFKGSRGARMERVLEALAATLEARCSTT
jgi:UDP-N-acetylmuramoyl-tripeptide--D-alanyl-D-alanine ligase